MPQIRQFDAPPLSLQPSETGVEATAQAGNRIGRFFNQVAAATTEVGNQIKRTISGSIEAASNVAYQYVEHREISQGAAAFAQLNDNLTQQWNDTAKNADPNDPATAAKFREQVLEPALDKYRQSFLTEGGQKFAEGRIDSLRNHMFEKTSADMSSLAKDAVAVNVRQTANSLSNTAMTDPSSVPHLLENADSLVGGMVGSAPNLKGADAARARMELTQKMKEGVVKSGAIGAIMQAANPEAEAAKWGAKYPEYISGDELKMLAANARQQIRARRVDDSYAEHLQTKEQQRVSDARETGYLQKIYSDDPQEQAQVSTKNIVNDASLTRESKERMIRLVDREMKPETDARVSAQSASQLFRMMRDPNADPEKVKAAIFDARAKDPGTPGSINKADFADLQKNLLDLKTPQGQALAKDRDEFFKRYAGTIDGYLAQYGLHSALGQQKMYLAEKDAIRQEQMLKSKSQDPQSLYDPASPNFFGRPENLARYHVSMQEAMDFNSGKNVNLTGPNKTITGISVEDKPPLPEARKAPDGNWYIERDGKYYRVKQ